MTRVIVSSAFERLGSAEFRFLGEAALHGTLEVLLWSDAAVRALLGRPPAFPESEREYVVGALRPVTSLRLSGPVVSPDSLPDLPGGAPDVWAVPEAECNAAKRAFCALRGIRLQAIRPADLEGFPMQAPGPSSGRPKVVVTGCYDYFHSGHVRFFEEVSALGELYVVVGNDANVTHLKGEGHPLFPALERRYVAGSIRFVHQALISSGWGWMDAEPEIAQIRPDIYAVNEDGDKPEKREFCLKHGLRYAVLKRTPKEGLPRRSSTDLRGF